jgi:hypothetical protein
VFYYFWHLKINDFYYCHPLLGHEERGRGVRTASRAVNWECTIMKITMRMLHEQFKCVVLRQ